MGKKKKENNKMSKQAADNKRSWLKLIIGVTWMELGV